MACLRHVSDLDEAIKLQLTWVAPYSFKFLLCMEKLDFSNNYYSPESRILWLKRYSKTNSNTDLFSFKKNSPI